MPKKMLIDAGHREETRVVVIEGRANHQLSAASEVKSLEPGSYFGSTGKASHQVSVDAKEPCVLYVRSEGKFNVTSE